MLPGLLSAHDPRTAGPERVATAICALEHTALYDLRQE